MKKLVALTLAALWILLGGPAPSGVTPAIAQGSSPVPDSIVLEVARPRAAVLNVHQGAAASFLGAVRGADAAHPLTVSADLRLVLAAEFEALFLPLTAGWAQFGLEAWRVTPAGRQKLAEDAAEVALFGPGRRSGHLKLPVALPVGLHRLVLYARTAVRPVGVADWQEDVAQLDLWVLVGAGLAPVDTLPPLDPLPGSLYVGDCRAVAAPAVGGALNFETGHNARLVARVGDPVPLWSQYELWWSAAAQGALRAELAVFRRDAGAATDPAPIARDLFEAKDLGPRLFRGRLVAKVQLPAGTHALTARLKTTAEVGGQVVVDVDEVPFSLVVLPTPPATGAISGAVWGEDGVALAGVGVIAHLPNGGPVARTRTGEDGRYLLDGLPPNRYLVQAVPADLNYRGEWWNDRPDRDRADPVAVAAGQVVADVSFKLTPGGTITGRVMDRAGKPLGGIEITVGPLRRPASAGGALPPVPSDDTLGLFRTRTNGEGYYAVDQLTAGSWWVRAVDPKGRFRTEFYRDRHVFEDADPVPVAAGQVTRFIDFVLEAGGAIAGQVRLETMLTVVLPLPGMVVEACDPADPTVVKAAAVTDLQGRFTLGGLAPGPYLVRALDPTGGHAAEWFREVADPAAAEKVVVEPGGTTAPVDFTLAKLGPVPRIFLDPPAISLAAGGEGSVAVSVADVAALGAFEATLRWDAKVVMVTGVELGPFLGSTGRQVVPVPPQIRNDQGTLRYAAATLGVQPGAEGGGVLFHVRLKAVAQGETRLAFADSILTDVRGQPLRHERQDCAVRVGGCMFGDFDCNCVIDIRDVMAVVARWGTRQGDADYDRRFDLDADGDIDIVDVQIEAGLWGQRCADPSDPAGRAAPVVIGSAAGARLALVAQPAAPRVGAQVQVAVDVGAVVDLAGFELALTYDPARLGFVGAEVGALLGSGGRAVAALGPQTVAGEVRFGAYALPGGEAPSGAGRLAVLTFEVLAEGDAHVRVAEAWLVDGAGQAAPASGGETLVQGQSTGRGGATLYLPLAMKKR